MRAVTLIQALLGLSILAAMPVVGRGVAPIVLAVQVVGGLGVLAAALASIRTTRGREVDLQGWMGVTMAAWTYVACLAAGLNGQYSLLGVDLVVGIFSSGLGTWVALRPQPTAAHQPAFGEKR